MKKAIIQMACLAGLAMMSVFSAEAQMAQKYRAQIPFDFNIGDRTFAAGEYIIERTNPRDSQSGLTIREAKSGRAQMFQVVSASNDETLNISALVFNRYENRLFLAELNTPTLNAKFRRTKVEVRLAKNRTPMRETVLMK